MIRKASPEMSAFDTSAPVRDDVSSTAAVRARKGYVSGTHPILLSHSQQFVNEGQG